jgi:hypothetical protein
MDMLDRAIATGASIDVLEKLMGLQERWERNQAKRAFDNALADAKAKFPIIRKSRQVEYPNRTGGRTGYSYEDLADIARAIDEPLAEHGLSYRFRTASPPGERVSVTCIVSHRDGHSEENTLSDNPDTSGAKNSVQAIGSIVTYLQRYTLKAALGLAAAVDDDAQSHNSKPPEPASLLITPAQVETLKTALEIADVATEEFLQRGSISDLSELRADRYEAALKWIQSRRESGDGAAQS